MKAKYLGYVALGVVGYNAVSSGGVVPLMLVGGAMFVLGQTSREVFWRKKMLESDEQFWSNQSAGGVGDLTMEERESLWKKRLAGLLLSPEHYAQASTLVQTLELQSVEAITAELEDFEVMAHGR